MRLPEGPASGLFVHRPALLRRLMACCLALLPGTAVRGQEETLPVIKVVLRPARLPSPALRYRLLPDLSEQTSGDAAPLYREAAKVLKGLEPRGEEAMKWWEQQSQWREMPLKELPCAEVRRALERYRGVLRVVEKAARCERCDWGVTEKLRQRGISGAVSPDLQLLRESAGLLDLRARLEMAEGKLDQAVGTLRTGLAMARHVGEEPTLIASLVGIALTYVMMSQVDSFIQCDGAPNLYWALSDLPRPFINLRGALQGERLMLYCTFPGFGTAAADPNMGPLNPKDARACVNVVFELRRAERMLAPLFTNNSPPDPPLFSRRLAELLPEEFQKPLERWEEDSRERMHFARSLQQHHAEAKGALIASGRPRERVEAMPFIQVAILHGLQDYDRLMDDCRRWEGFPFWESRPQLRRLVAQAEQEVKGKGKGRVLSTSLLAPTVERIFAARARLDRKIAALRCLEAVRLYAAAHHGRLPTTLGVIKEVPIPRDPMTGKDFEYHIEGDRARLYGPPPEGEIAHLGNYVWYELTLKR